LLAVPTNDEEGRINRSTAMISRSALHRCLILALLLSFSSVCHAAWIPSTSVATTRSKPTPTPLRCSFALATRSRHRAAQQLYSNQSNDNESDKEEEEAKKEGSFDMNEFLDTPFFDPDKVLNDANSSPLLKRFAAFVQQDYETAEAVLTGLFFVMLIIGTQEVLRMQMNGANYVPFTRGTIPGSLF
jgi:hypothetical protein